ncbi:hypothetical protein GHK45_02855 [Sinorhizobium meliloti]|uniref:Uncharacterized protein n=1 Tax=Rhizobium meliloti TaxID=382 RepID=A0A6A7ZIL9_RHIML|nr:hypothetical protein [Sinorhizobium meliloti]MQW02803.1 hypothetical protein [Sinorhizobium meliloti]
MFHHYYLDTRGYAPPDPDPVRFEYLDLFTSSEELRAVGDGLGIGTAFRRASSSLLGQAFCRWFLHDHLNVTYFAHMDDVLNRPPHPDFGEHSVKRLKAGDAPDYLCAENAHEVFLAEAKGRVNSVSFKNAEFERWRKQFERVAVIDGSGTNVSVKGHIVATRFATQADSHRTKSKLFAEDPASPGRRQLRDAPEIGSAVIALHYADLVAKLRQPILSSSLRLGSPVPGEILFPAFTWEFIGPPLQGKRFVGGYFPDRHQLSATKLTLNGDQSAFLSPDPWRLDLTPGTFFGIVENIFEGLCAMARNGDRQASEIQRFPDIPLLR